MADEDLDLTSASGRLKWARRRAYANAADFARVAKVPEVTYRAYENGQNGFAKHASDFGRLLNVPTDWLLKGGPLPGTAAPIRVPQVLREPDIPPFRHADEGETVEITSLDLSFSMGPGATIDDYIEESPVQFDLGFLRGITRTPPERLRLARGVGDSMFPTLQSSDRVMIDTTQRMLNLQDRIWAVSLFGAAAIKRLRSIGGKQVLVISDNRDVENQPVDAEDLVIAGRVIWFGRDV